MHGHDQRCDPTQPIQHQEPMRRNKPLPPIYWPLEFLHPCLHTVSQPESNRPPAKRAGDLYEACARILTTFRSGPLRSYRVASLPRRPDESRPAPGLNHAPPHPPGLTFAHSATTTTLTAPLAPVPRPRFFTATLRCCDPANLHLHMRLKKESHDPGNAPTPP